MHKIRYMKRIILSVLVLSSAMIFAQEKDSIKSNNIEEVIVNGKYYKKICGEGRFIFLEIR